MAEAEATRWHLRNINCKQVILGISHDAGYAPFLDEVLRDEETRRRITILEGFPAVRELMVMGLNTLNLNDAIFRSEKLVDRTPPMPAPPQQLAWTARAAGTAEKGGGAGRGGASAPGWGGGR